MGTHSVSEVRLLFVTADAADLPDLIEKFSADSRAGVRALVTSAQRKLAAEEAERDRVRLMMTLQRQLHESGYTLIAGVDEVGRGALAGPVSAAAVILGADCHIPGLDDSKRLSPSAREVVALRVHDAAIAVSVAHIPPDQIDALGIGGANTLAMRTAIQTLPVTADHALGDGLPVDLGMSSTFVVGGDRKCACIAAASVVAKVERDRLMKENDALFPGYQFSINKGYGTVEHIEAIQRIGPSPIHRLSFSPCSQDRLF